MDKNELPSSVPLDNALLFRDDVPAVVLRTFARLYALAWKHHYDRTDRIVTSELLAILNLSERQMYDHISKLRKLDVLAWTSDGGYGYIFTFPKNLGVLLPDDAASAGSGLAGTWVTGPAAIPSWDSSEPAAEVSSWNLDGSSPAASGLRPEPIAANISSPGAAISSPGAAISSPGAAISSLAASVLPPEPVTAENRSWNPGGPGAEIRTPTAEIRSWGPGEPDASTAENRSPGAEIRSWDSDEPAATAGSSAPTAENRSPGAEIRSWDSGEPAATAGSSAPTAENRSPGAEIRSPGAEIRTSEAARRIADPSVVVVVNNIPDLDLEQQQQQLFASRKAGQQQDPARASTAENRTPSAEIRTWPELEAALAQAGMWDDLAAGLTAGLDVNGVLDALGWIAAVRADRRVHNHGAVLVKHLQAGRHAPADWRPPGVCVSCGAVEGRCTCGVQDRTVPAVYYTAAIEPVREWGRDRWGVCQTCGRVDCDGHDQVGVVEEPVVRPAASNGASGQGNGLESRIHGAWPGVAQYIQARYGVEINLAEVGNYQVQVTFAGDERGKIVNVTRTMLNRQLKDYVEVVDAGPA